MTFCTVLQIAWLSTFSALILSLFMETQFSHFPLKVMDPFHLTVASSATGKKSILRGHILGQEKVLEVGFPRGVHQTGRMSGFSYEGAR